MPVEDIFLSGVEERAVHVHLPSLGRSSATLVVASAIWPGTVCPAEVMAVECHEEVIEGHNMVTTRVRMVQPTLTCVLR